MLFLRIGNAYQQLCNANYSLLKNRKPLFFLQKVYVNDKTKSVYLTYWVTKIFTSFCEDVFIPKVMVKHSPMRVSFIKF